MQAIQKRDHNCEKNKGREGGGVERDVEHSSEYTHFAVFRSYFWRSGMHSVAYIK
jgi:hypothetical protein